MFSATAAALPSAKPAYSCESCSWKQLEFKKHLISYIEALSKNWKHFISYLHMERDIRGHMTSSMYKMERRDWTEEEINVVQKPFKGINIKLMSKCK